MELKVEEFDAEDRIKTLEKRVGQPGSEQSKPLFEIVEALNRELLELRLKIEELELKEEKKL